MVCLLSVRQSGSGSERVGVVEPRMERHYSVDDIVGTLWNSGGELSNEAGNGDEDEYNLKGLNRSASEWAFQEFIKHNFQIPSRNDALTHVSSDSEPENDEDYPHAPMPEEVENDDARAQEDGSKLSPKSGVEPKEEDVSVGSTAAPKVDEHADSTASKPKETSEKPSFKEPEIKAALNPLFSGLHSEMTAAGRDPQEINTYFQEKLAEACLKARKAREGVLALPKSGQGHAVGLLSASKATSGAQSANIRTSGGGVVLEIPSKPVTSGSSQDQSDDEEIDNEQNLEPGDKKRVKRMLSNRESARRSRRRKQAHLNELESQVAQLRVQNSTLAESLQSTSQKLKDASKDNLQLKTYVEMLKAKLLAANTMHRQLSMASPNVHVRAPLGTQEMPSISRAFGWESGPHAMQPPRSNPYLMHPPMTSAAMAQINNQHLELEQQSISMTVQQGMKMSRTPSMQRVGSMDHMKKKFRNAAASCSPTSWAPTSMVDLDGPSTMIPQFTLSSEY